MKGWRLAAAACCIALMALVTVPAESISPRRAYLKELKSWTDELKIYRGFQTALILRATYLSGPMREELAQERQRLLNPTPGDHQAFEARMQADNSAYHDVVFSASTPIEAAQRFGEADTGWVIWLEADGTREELVSVERIRRPSPLHKELYAHMNLWSELWIARFTRTVSMPDEVVLHVGSGYGNGDVAWSSLRERK